jgi:hypothetical protein
MSNEHPAWRTVPIDEVVRANVTSGHHFFDRETLRFFSSRIARTAQAATVEMRDDGGRVWRVRVALFVTSEQFVPFDGPPDPRRWTVRLHCWDLDRTWNYASDELGTFQQYASGKAANATVRHVVDTWSTRDLTSILERNVRWWRKVDANA